MNVIDTGLLPPIEHRRMCRITTVHDAHWWQPDHAHHSSFCPGVSIPWGYRLVKQEEQPE